MSSDADVSSSAEARILLRQLIPEDVMCRTFASSWKRFYERVTGRQPRIDEDVLRENASRLKAARISWLLDSLTEASVQQMLPVLCPLVNYVLEDTHDTVRDYSAKFTDEDGNTYYQTDGQGVACQRCSFGRTDGRPPGPDFTLRGPLPGDAMSAVFFGGTVEKQLPSYRMLPFNTYAVFELEGQEVELRNDRIAFEVCRRYESLLRADVRRQYVFGVVTNLINARFCAAKFEEGGEIRGYTTERPVWLDDERRGKPSELACFLSTDPQSFVGEPAFPPRGVTRVEALGHGSSAVVLELTQQDKLAGSANTSVVKISRDSEALTQRFS